MSNEPRKRIARIHIYKVEIDGEIKLVRTTSRARAINRFRKQNITAVIPSQDELVDLIKAEIPIEDIEAPK